MNRKLTFHDFRALSRYILADRVDLPRNRSCSCSLPSSTSPMIYPSRGLQPFAQGTPQSFHTSPARNTSVAPERLESAPSFLLSPFSKIHIYHMISTLLFPNHSINHFEKLLYRIFLSFELTSFSCFSPNLCIFCIFTCRSVLLVLFLLSIVVLGCHITRLLATPS